MAMNPNDGEHYVWDWNNDVYVRVVRSIPPDFADCKTAEVYGTPAFLMKLWDLKLNQHDFRNEDELNTPCLTTMFFDTKDKVIGFHSMNGVVASIKEWSSINWFAEAESV